MKYYKEKFTWSVKNREGYYTMYCSSIEKKETPSSSFKHFIKLYPQGIYTHWEENK